jgi:hypothetical protein
LEHHVTAVGEADIDGCKIVFPHATEALIVKFGCPYTVGCEAPASVLQCVMIVQP